MSDKPYKTGVIHGRFQILHNDHLEYLLSGAKLCNHLVVGITNPAPAQTRQETADSNRGREEANPLTYFERYQLVQAVLLEAGLTYHEFSIVPFPINYPERYHYYLPMDAVFFLTIYDEWGRRKQDYFNSLGLQVHILRNVPSEEKGISASEIRSLIIKDLAWEHLVPPNTVPLLKQWKVPARLKGLK